MNLELDLMERPPVRVTTMPPQDGQCYKLLLAMKQGKSFTVAEALSELGIYALSQRAGQLKNQYFWPIKSKWETTPSGAVVKRYYLED